MNSAQQAQDYVRAAAAVLALPLADEQVQRVAAHLERTAAMAALLEGAELAVTDEPAEIFRPVENEKGPQGAPVLPGQL